MQRTIYSLLLVGGLLLLMPVVTHAMTISPAVTEITIDPGTTIEREITLFNETAQSINLSARIESFIPKGEHGSSQLVNDANQALRWIQLSKNTVTLKPGASQKVSFLVTVPKTAEVGGHYAAIVWQQSTPGGSNVGLNGRVGALLLLTVNGEIKRSLAIEDFDVYLQNILSPLTAQVRVRNTGTVHLKPRGMVVVKNIFNRVVTTIPLNTENGNILPESVRQFEAVWSEKPRSILALLERLSIVRISAHIELEYDGGDKITSVEKSLWVVPQSIVISIVVIGSIILILLVYIFQKFKKIV